MAMLDIMLEKFAARVAELERAVYRQRQALPPLRLAPAGGRPDQQAALDPSWPEVPVGGQWGGYNQTAWLLGDLAIPEEWAGQQVLLSVRLGNYRALGFDILIAGPEALAYLDGVPFAGVDRWHEALLLTPKAQGGERYRLAIEAFSARVREPHRLVQYELVVRDPAADALAHDLRAAYDTLKVLSPAGEDSSPGPSRRRSGRWISAGMPRLVPPPSTPRWSGRVRPFSAPSPATGTAAGRASWPPATPTSMSPGSGRWPRPGARPPAPSPPCCA
jgi:hypothetical protein